MPSKYVIHTREVPDRFKPLTRSGIIAWEEGCLKCAVCVKKQCVYGVYDNRGLDPRQMIDSIDNQCMNCYRCVQSCPRELIHKAVNPEFMAMGDTHWTPDIIARLWYQSQTGKIPVSGAGYPGPFTGPGFDSMWTDMSEIVRPTRDGIHGREYISTSIDIGSIPKHLSFSENGEMTGDEPVLLDLPLPIIFRVPFFGAISEKTLKGWAMAAKKLGIPLAIPESMISGEMEEYKPNLVPVFGPEDKIIPLGDDIPMVEVMWDKKNRDAIDEVKRLYPKALIAARIPLTGDSMEDITELIHRGCTIFDLQATFHGRRADDQSRFAKDDIRAIHQALVKEGIRNDITLLGGGGIAMAEHVAKAVICGVDGVFVDFPILIALECRMCMRCTKGLSCPVEIEKASSKWVAARTVNIMGAWHNQLLEIMGAMGIRECRRLRGEAGRAMFFEELDREIFGAMGKPEEGIELE